MSVPAWFKVLGFVATTGDAGLYTRTGAHGSGAFANPPVVSWVSQLPAAPNGLQSELGAPVIHGERVYVGSSQRNVLFVLDRENGAILDQLTANGPVMAAAVIMGDHILFSDAAGYTWCYPVGGGPAVWSHFSGAPLLATPTVDGGRLYVETVDGQTIALDVTNGDLVWRHEQKMDPGRSTELALFGAPAPVVAGDALITGHSDGTVVALDRGTGDVLWQRRVGEGRFPDVLASATVIDGLAAVTGYTEPMVGLDVQSHAGRWRLDDVGGAAGPLLAGDRLYHGGIDGKLRAIDPRSGTVDWTWDSKTDGALSAPVLTDAGLLVGSAVGGLYLVNTNTGKLVWSLELEKSLIGVASPPAVDGRQAVVLTNAGEVVSLLAPEGPGPLARIRGLGERVLPAEKRGSGD